MVRFNMILANFSLRGRDDLSPRDCSNGTRFPRTIIPTPFACTVAKVAETSPFNMCFSMKMGQYKPEAQASELFCKIGVHSRCHSGSFFMVPALLKGLVAETFEPDHSPENTGRTRNAEALCEFHYGKARKISSVFFPQTGNTELAPTVDRGF